MIHLHVRDREFGHSLDPKLYEEAIAAIRNRVGQDLIIQITTEAVGRYSPEQQIDTVRQVRPEAVSLALREICPGRDHEPSAGEFFHWLYQAGIYAQYIVYDLDDIQRLKDLRRHGLIPGDGVAVLLVLGRYSRSLESDPAQLKPLVDATEQDWLWSVCAFGRRELECMAAAIALGGHCRVGFENNLYLADSKVAPDNSVQVAAVSTLASERGLGASNAQQAREILGNTTQARNPCPLPGKSR